jgi:hypothetical protein
LEQGRFLTQNSSTKRVASEKQLLKLNKPKSKL